MQSSKDIALQAIEGISSIAKETVATMEEASATTKEQTSSAEELSVCAVRLNKMASELKHAISLFKT